MGCLLCEILTYIIRGGSTASRAQAGSEAHVEGGQQEQQEARQGHASPNQPVVRRGRGRATTDCSDYLFCLLPQPR